MKRRPPGDDGPRPPGLPGQTLFPFAEETDMGERSKIEWTDHTFNPWRLVGWLCLPIPWLWRGCWDWGAAAESWRQGWREFWGISGPFGEEASMLTKEQLDAIRRRADAASPGPWEPATDKHVCAAEGFDLWFGRGPLRKVARREDGKAEVQPDAEFIAHARQDLPALLAEVERLRGEGGRP